MTVPAGALEFAFHELIRDTYAAEGFQVDEIVDEDFVTVVYMEDGRMALVVEAEVDMERARFVFGLPGEPFQVGD